MYTGEETQKLLFEKLKLDKYDSFEQCVDDIRAGNKKIVPQEKVDELNEIFAKPETQQGLQFIEYFEKNYQCSGICETAMFYYTLNMEDGPPVETCNRYMKEFVSSNLTMVGIVTFLAGLVMLCLHCCQYNLWKKYDDEGHKWSY